MQVMLQCMSHSPSKYPNPVKIAMLDPITHICVSNCSSKSGKRTLKPLTIPMSRNKLNVTTPRTRNDLGLSFPCSAMLHVASKLTFDTTAIETVSKR